MNAARRTYTSGQVARALELPSRRVEGWTEAGLIKPRISKGASRHGDRRRFAWGDIIVCGVLAQVQRILGGHLRPGAIARLVVKEFDTRSAEFAVLGDPARPALLLIESVDGKPRATVSFNVHAHQLDAAIVVNLTRLGLKLERNLGHER